MTSGIIVFKVFPVLSSPFSKEEFKKISNQSLNNLTFKNLKTTEQKERAVNGFELITYYCTADSDKDGRNKDLIVIVTCAGKDKKFLIFNMIMEKAFYSKYKDEIEQFITSFKPLQDAAAGNSASNNDYNKTIFYDDYNTVPDFGALDSNIKFIKKAAVNEGIGYAYDAASVSADNLNDYISVLKQNGFKYSGYPTSPDGNQAFNSGNTILYLKENILVAIVTSTDAVVIAIMPQK